MNIEEAKANIGKEVVLLEDTKPYTHSNGKIFNKAVSKQLESIECLKIDFITRGNIVVNTLLIDPKHIALKQPTFKVGDQVVLDESTKPYTYLNLFSDIEIKHNFLRGSEPYRISSAEDRYGNVCLCGFGLIHPRHLKIAPQQEVKLPSSILDGLKNDLDTSARKMNRDQLKKISNNHCSHDVESSKSDVVDFEQNHPRLKDVTNLLQKLDVAFSVDENEIAFTVKYGDNSFQVMKHDKDALLYSEALFIASSLGKSDEFNLIQEKQTKACILLQNNGYKVNLTMRGIEVL